MSRPVQYLVERRPNKRVEAGYAPCVKAEQKQFKT